MEHPRTVTLCASAHSCRSAAITRREPGSHRRQRKPVIEQFNPVLFVSCAHERALPTTLMCRSSLVDSNDFLAQARPDSVQRDRQVYAYGYFSSFEACASHHRKVRARILHFSFLLYTRWQSSSTGLIQRLDHMVLVFCTRPVACDLCLACIRASWWQQPNLQAAVHRESLHFLG